MDAGNRTSTKDSGFSDMESQPPSYASDIDALDNTVGNDYSAEFKRYAEEMSEIAKETMTDRKKVITNPGWHHNKPSLHQVPIDMSRPGAQEGYGIAGDTCCQRTGLFCGNHCGCPSKKTLQIGTIRVVARIVMFVLVWAFVWTATFPSCAVDDGEDDQDQNGNDTAGENLTIIPDRRQEEDECIIPGFPGTSLFGIVMVFLWGMVAEALIVLIPLPFDLPPLPPLLGSLLVGIILRNVPGINVAVPINDLTSTRLRNMALGIILGRAGLEVDKKQMYNLRWVVPRLAFLPCIIEACSYGLFAHWILALPWEWSFMLGFVCGAVAPACVVPSMIKFSEQGLGLDHGVPSLLMAAASIDDIVAINVFNILLTITFGGASIGYDVGIAFAEIALGIALGLVGGFFLQKVPDRRQHNVIRDRTFLLAGISFFFIFVTDGPIDLAGAGTLGTLVCSFVAAIGWQHNQAEAVAQLFKRIWFYFQPLLFGLTGATVDISQMEADTIARAILCMLICLTIRLAVAGNAVSFLGWSHKEKFMTSISWIPKATVQAAIGGAALSRVHLECDDILAQDICNNGTETTGGPSLGDSINNRPASGCVAPGTPEYDEWNNCVAEMRYAEIILQVSVLLIIITAPIGVFLIGVAGPKLLPKSTAVVEMGGLPNDSSSDDENESGWTKDLSTAENGGRPNGGYTNDEEGSLAGETKL